MGVAANVTVEPVQIVIGPDGVILTAGVSDKFTITFIVVAPLVHPLTVCVTV